MLGIDELYKELKSSNFLVDIDSRKIRKGSVFFAIKGIILMEMSLLVMHLKMDLV